MLTGIASSLRRHTLPLGQVMYPHHFYDNKKPLLFFQALKGAEKSSEGLATFQDNIILSEFDSTAKIGYFTP
jgi:hypothetical protein